jgi:quercetin dioxygenase-like cupin family protein
MLAKSQQAVVQDLPWGRLEWITSEAQGNSTTMTFGRVTIKAGQANPRHRHPNCDEILHLLSGRLEHSLGDDQTFIMEAGDTISIPTGVFHNARALGSDDAVMVICFSAADRQTESEEGTDGA